MSSLAEVGFGSVWANSMSLYWGPPFGAKLSSPSGSPPLSTTLVFCHKPAPADSVGMVR